MPLSKDAMERAVRGYFAACNEGDVERIAAYFAPDGTHYFPAGSPFGTLRGPQAIGRCWAQCVRELGSHWVIDRFVADASAGVAVIEWTHVKRKLGQVLRGDEWYRFAEDGLIREIRAYYACPTQAGTGRHELGGFDYSAHGYHDGRTE